MNQNQVNLNQLTGLIKSCIIKNLASNVLKHPVFLFYYFVQRFQAEPLDEWLFLMRNLRTAILHIGK